MKSLLRLALVAVLAGCAPSPDATTGASDDDTRVASDIKLPPLGLEGGASELASAADDPVLRKLQIHKIDDLKYFAWHIEFDTAENCAAFKVPGTQVVDRFQKWLVALVPDRAFTQELVFRSPGRVWIDAEGPPIVPPTPPPAVAATRALPEPIVRSGLSGLKGKGTIIAVVDSGIDFRHPDFISTDAQGRPVSRIAFFWDTLSNDHQKGIGQPGPVSYPNGVAIGTVYTRDQLTQELRSSQKKIGPTDTNGHGTACAGIAAGNGMVYADRRYAGVAPEADLIGVRVGAEKREFPNTYLLSAACTWIDGIAGKTPVVISCSFGGQYGGRDGSTVGERHLDARFPSTLRGRALCIAAGNEARHQVHAEASFSSQKGRIEWTVPAGSQAQTLLYFNTGDLADLHWTTVGKDEVKRSTLRSQVNPFTKQGVVSLATGPGSYAIELWTASGNPCFADAYIARADGKNVPYFTGPSAIARRQVASPGTTQQAITVGSYDFNHLLFVDGKTATYGYVNADGKSITPLPLGAISDYSNPGPRRMGDATKPEIVAPGRYHTASRVLDLPKQENEYIETSGKYRYFDGTSAATPYCAGVIALMFEKNPSLTVGEIKSILQSKASRDPRTGTTPNGLWGYGKLDLKAVQAVLAAVKKP